MKTLFAYKFTIASALLILVALLLPSTSLPKVPSFIGIDKAAHFVLFLIFTLAYLLETKAFRKKVPKLPIAAAFVLVFIGFSEVLQLFTSSRHFELLDILFDALGAAAAFLLATLTSAPQKD